MQKNIISISFKAILLLFSLVFLAISFVLSELLLQKQISRNLEELEISKKIFFAKTLATNLSDDFLLRRQELESLVKYLIVPKRSPSDISMGLNELQNSFSFYSWLGYASIEGQIIAATNDILVGKNVAHRPWFVKGQEQAYIGDVHEALLLSQFLKLNRLGEPQRLIDIAVPIVTPNEGFIGVLGAHISFDWIAHKLEKLSESGLNNATQILLVGKDQTIYYPENKLSEKFDVDLTDSQLMPKVRAMNDGNFLVVSVPLFENGYDPLGWYLVLKTHEDKVFEPLQSFREILFISYATMILFLFVAVVIKLRLLLVPLNLLVNKVQNIGQESASRDHSKIVISEFSILDDAIDAANNKILQQYQMILQNKEQLEEKVSLRTHELKESLAEVSRMHNMSKRIYASVAHELRNPVASINMLSNEESGWVGARKSIRVLSEQLIMILDDMKLAINPNLHISVHLTFVDLNEFFQSIDILMEPIIKATGVDFQRRLGVTIEDMPNYWQIDVFRLRVVVSNLIKNACLHSNGTCVTCEINVNGGQLLIDVKDNGIGIDPETFDKLCEPLQRGDTQSEGTGMGLYIAKHWLESIDGHLSCRECENGTHIRVSVPTKRSENFPAVVSENDVLDGNRSNAIESKITKTVYLLDDDAISRLVAQILLSNFFSTVVECENAATVISNVNNIDILFTDLHMPDMKGYELIASLRESGFKGYIVALTGSTDQEEHQQLLNAGADEIFIKPIGIREIIKLATHFE